MSGLPEGSSPDNFVLDAMANDIESVDDLVRILNSDSELGWSDVWGRPFARNEVVAAVRRLVLVGLARTYTFAERGIEVTPLADGVLPSNMSDAYFGMTDRGRAAHAAWDAPDGPPSMG